MVTWYTYGYTYLFLSNKIVDGLNGLSKTPPFSEFMDHVPKNTRFRHGNADSIINGAFKQCCGLTLGSGGLYINMNLSKMTRNISSPISWIFSGVNLSSY